MALMGLFKFFKKKEKETSIDYAAETNGCRIIDKGILFEDARHFLKWGMPVAALAVELNPKKEIRADRVIYRWGEHVILNGLKLDLSTVLWNPMENGDNKSFNSIEYLSLGDQLASQFVKNISAHLEEQLGSAGFKETSDNEASQEWKIGDVKISLYYAEMRSYRLHFKITVPCE